MKTFVVVFKYNLRLHVGVRRSLNPYEVDAVLPMGCGARGRIIMVAFLSV